MQKGGKRYLAKIKVLFTFLFFATDARTAISLASFFL